MRLASLYELTVYDAAYLELTPPRRLPLATLDAALIRAAGQASVSVLPLASGVPAPARRLLDRLISYCHPHIAHGNV